MLRAKQSREVARMALKNRWALALGVTLLATILGGNVSNGVTFSYRINANEAEEVEGYFNSPDGLMNFFRSETFQSFLPFLIYGLVLSLLIGIAFFVISGAVQVGFNRFTLGLVDGAPVSVKTLFSGFHDMFGKALLCVLLRSIYLFLWCLPGTILSFGGIFLFFWKLPVLMQGDQNLLLLVVGISCVLIGSIYLLIVPIIKTLGYDQAFFLLAEHSDMGPNQVITASRKMMRGNKGRLFCLELSFIGWAFLCCFTFGIGFLWLSPYICVSKAVFYRDMVTSNQEQTIPVDGESITAPTL